MPRCTFFLVVSIATGCVSEVSAPASLADAPVLPYDISELDSPIERLAFEIHALDIAAWRATDRAMEAGIDLQEEGIDGWIALLDGTRAVVRFIDERPAEPLAVVDVAIDVAAPTPGRVARNAPGVRLSDLESSMWRARQLAAGSDYRACSDAYNTVVLRDPDSEEWLVYLLASTRSSDLVVGGHHRFRVSPDGERILEAKPLSMSCLTAAIEPETEIFVFLQNASEDPLETSVLLSLQVEFPIMFRVPPGSVWMATQGHLTQVREEEGSGD